jgi:hypothetical protein
LQLTIDFIYSPFVERSHFNDHFFPALIHLSEAPCSTGNKSDDDGCLLEHEGNLLVPEKEKTH